MRFDHPLIVGLAKKYGRGPAHIFLRYPLQKVRSSVDTFHPHTFKFSQTLCAQGFVPLVKSADHRRIVSNADVFDFELDATEIEELDQLDECTYFVCCSGVLPHLWLISSTKDLLTDWDPTDCP
jgi:diketogulonate reductase-like aldo/keto reductase